MKNSIGTLHYNTMLICFHKLIIKEKLPYHMDELTLEMCVKCGRNILPENLIISLFNIVRELLDQLIWKMDSRKISYRLHVYKVMCCK